MQRHRGPGHPALVGARVVGLVLAAVLAAPSVPSARGDAAPDGAPRPGVTVGGGCGLTLTPWTPPDSAFELQGLVAVGDELRGVATDGRVLLLDGGGRPRTDQGAAGVVDGLAGVAAWLGYDDGRVVLAARPSPDHIELVQLDVDGRPDRAFGEDGRVTVDLGDGPSTPSHGLAIATAPDGDLLLTTARGAEGIVVRLQPDGTRRSGFGSDGVAAFSLAEGDMPANSVARPSGGLLVVGTADDSSLGTGTGVVWVTTADGAPDPAVGVGGRVELDGPVGTQALVATDDTHVAFADADDPDGRIGTFDVADGRVRTAAEPLPTVGDVRRVGSRWVAGATSRPGGFGDPLLVTTRRDTRGRVDDRYGDGGTSRLDPQARVRMEVPAHTAVHPDGAVSAVAVTQDWDGTPAVVQIRVEPDGRLTARHGWCPDDDRAPTTTVRRLAGATRFATAVEVSRTGYPDGADHVVIATGTTFPDALAGGPAAATQAAPILLVERDGVPTEVAEELRRLAPSSVTLLGGPAALSLTVAEQVATLTRLAPRRIAGADRHATAAEISRATFEPGVPVAFVTTGANFPDALATGAIAGTLGGPVLLTARDAVPDATVRELERLRPDEMVVVGGPDAVGDTLQVLQGRFGDRVTGVAGADRYATAREVVTRFRDEPDGHLGRPVTTVFLATGTNFPDALAGAAAAGAAGGVVALVPPDTFDERVRDVLGRLHPRTIYVLGADGAVQPVWDAELRGIGATSWTYIADPPGATEVIRWNPCEPIPWVFNPDGAPPGGEALVRDGLARITQATGWTFTYLGHTDEPLQLSHRSPYQPSRYGDRWAPVLMGWGDPTAGGGAAGQAGPTWVDDAIVTGELVLNRHLSLPVNFDEGGWGDILLHEVGHVLGLDHPGDVTQTMYWRVVSGVSGLQEGDLAGLRRLREGGCRTVPTPQRVPTRSTSRATRP